MRNFLFIAMAALAVALVGCHKHQPSPQQALSAQLDSLFSEYFVEDAPGAAVVVMQGDSMIYGRGFGLARMDTLTKVDLNTMFNICSVSKQFSAVALLKLAEQGRLSLDDKVLKYFPELPREVFKDITLRHLLSHTSGIPDSRPRTEAEWKEYRKRRESRFDNVSDFARLCEEDESLGYLYLLDSLSFAPGTRYEYMNPTYQMMLSIVEQVTGENFDDWMHENIFIPAGMDSTVYYEEGRYIPHMAHGYIRNDAGEWEENDYGEANFFGTKADGGIYTSPLEFVKWDYALYNDLVMSEQSRIEAHTPRIQTDIPNTAYGYGWFIEKHPGRPQKIYHTGDNGGFLIFEGRFPEKNLFYLIFATHPDWQREATVERVDSILQTLGYI